MTGFVVQVHILHLELYYVRSWDHFAINTAVNLTKTWPDHFTPQNQEEKNKVEE